MLDVAINIKIQVMMDNLIGRIKGVCSHPVGKLIISINWIAHLLQNPTIIPTDPKTS